MRKRPSRSPGAGGRPGDAGATDVLVRCLLAEDDLLGAWAALNQAADPDDPRLAWVQRETGLALRRTGFWEDAEPVLARAVAREPWDTALAKEHARTRTPAWLAPVVLDPASGAAMRRFSPRKSSTYQFIVDVAGACNLRCPTCPVGNSPLGGRSTGLMPPELFERILAKIVAESPAPDPQIVFYNWGEPLLHPALPAFIRQVRDAGLRSQLSTTLNIARGLEQIVAAGPDEMKISLSGFTPATYGRTHVRGDLGQVKENMRAVRRFLDRYKVPTEVWVGHHIYRSNRHEADAVRVFCEQLGFAWRPIDAFYMPLERVFDVLDGKIDARSDPVLDDLPVPPVERQRRMARSRSGQYDCELRFNQTVINHDGTVALCCVVYDQSNMLGVSFLDETLPSIEARKYRHSFSPPAGARGSTTLRRKWRCCRPRKRRSPRDRRAKPSPRATPGRSRRRARHRTNSRRSPLLTGHSPDDGAATRIEPRMTPSASPRPTTITGFLLDAARRRAAEGDRRGAAVSPRKPRAPTPPMPEPPACWRNCCCRPIPAEPPRSPVA